MQTAHLCSYPQIVAERFTPTQPAHVRAFEDGKQARLRDEPRDPAPYLERYAGSRSIIDPRSCWLQGYDETDERQRFELSRPRHGESDWSPVAVE